MVGAIAAWMITENRRLTLYASGHAKRLADARTIPTAPPGEQP